MENLPPIVDLSDLAASIDILCLRLEAFEPGLWWDLEECRRRVVHPAIASWIASYGFKDFHDLPPAALLAFYTSLQARVDKLAGEPPVGIIAATLPNDST